MKRLMIGLVAAAGLAIATPAMSQVFFGAGPGGFGVGVGGQGYYGDGYAPRYRGYGAYGYDRGYEGGGYARCRTRLVETRYGVRRIRRCW